MKRVFLLVGLTVVALFCPASDVLAADGWASCAGGTTGGAGGATVTASTASEFEGYVESSSTYIVQVSGTIDLYTEGVGGTVYMESNKTIRGVDSNATIVGQLRFEDDACNVIIERLNITNPYAGSSYDGISVKDRITNVFITKCTVYDCGDGGIDITKASDYVTVSLCKFYYSNPAPDEDHRFVSLVGGSDGDTGDRGKLHVTYHHNWWGARCRERMPRVRFGQVHCYNNYYACNGNNYCIRPGFEAQILVENEYFYYVDEPIDDKETGAVVEASGNIYDHCTNIRDVGTDDVFEPNYFYMPNDAEDVPDIVQAYAGADNPEPPHWLVTVYGDFDINGVVDENDLETFADYWLDTIDIDDADYFDNDRVDGREFARFAQNWRGPSEP